jgi:hypothetical protein
MSKEDKTIKVTLTFNEDRLNSILNSASFGENPLTVDEVIKAGRWEELERELNNSNFEDEIMDGSYEACANDWLCEFAREVEDEDEE